MELEDMMEEEHRGTHEKLEMLQSVVRTFELKSKNAQDHSKYHISVHCVAVHPRCLQCRALEGFHPSVMFRYCVQTNEDMFVRF